MPRRLLVLYTGLAVAFLVLPLVPIIVSSFSGGAEEYILFPPPGFSLKWYAGIQPHWVGDFTVSLEVGVVATLLALLLGVPAAYAIGRHRDAPGRALLRASLQLPLQIPLVVIGLIVMQYYLAVGRGTGVRLLDTFVGLILAHVVFELPFVISSVVPVVERFDGRWEEAAACLGASPSAIFRDVTLPIILPGVFAGGLYGFMVSFGNISVSLFLVTKDLATLPVDLFYTMEYQPSPEVLAVSTGAVVFSALLVWLVATRSGLFTSRTGGIKGVS